MRGASTEVRDMPAQDPAYRPTPRPFGNEHQVVRAVDGQRTAAWQVDRLHKRLRVWRK
jgi:hypothetical protein